MDAKPASVLQQGIGIVPVTVSETGEAKGIAIVTLGVCEKKKSGECTFA